MARKYILKKGRKFFSPYNTPGTLQAMHKPKQTMINKIFDLQKFCYFCCCKDPHKSKIC